MKDRVKKQIYEQTRARPGVVEANRAHAFTRYPTPPSQPPGYNPNITWRRRSYYSDRGEYFPLDPENFGLYSGQTFANVISSEKGNFSDQVPGDFFNAVYGCVLHSSRARLATIRIKCGSCSVTVYADNTEIFSSGNAGYLESDINIPVGRGNTVLRIFLYRRSGNAQFAVLGNLGMQIDEWSSLDFVPPPPPEWSDPALQYYPAGQSRAPVVELNWKDPYVLTPGVPVMQLQETWGYVVWKSEYLAVGGPVTVSGVNVEFSGNLAGKFVAGQRINLNSGDGGYYDILYARYNSLADLTTLTVSGTLGEIEAPVVYTQRLIPIATVPYVRQPDQVFEYYDYDVELGKSYVYYLTALDHLFNSSAKAGPQGITLSGLGIPVYNNSEHVISDYGVASAQTADGPAHLNQFTGSDGSESTVYCPVLVKGVEAPDGFTDHLVVQASQTQFFGNTVNEALVVQKNGYFTVSGTGRKMGAVWFDHCVRGQEYFFRLAAEDAFGHRGDWGAWVSETAGDFSGPPSLEPSQVFISSYPFGFTATVSGYARPADFDRFEWFINTANAFPGGQPVFRGPGNSANITTDNDNYYLFIRGVDTSGNYSPGYTSSLKYITPGLFTVSGVNVDISGTYLGEEGNSPYVGNLGLSGGYLSTGAHARANENTTINSILSSGTLLLNNTDRFLNSGFAYATPGETLGGGEVVYRLRYGAILDGSPVLTGIDQADYKLYSDSSWQAAPGAGQILTGWVVSNGDGYAVPPEKVYLDAYDNSFGVTDDRGQVMLKATEDTLSLLAGTINAGDINIPDDWGALSVGDTGDNDKTGVTIYSTGGSADIWVMSGATALATIGGVNAGGGLADGHVFLSTGSISFNMAASNLLGAYLSVGASDLRVSMDSGRSLYPFDDNSYDWGKAENRWRNAYAGKVVTDDLVYPVITGHGDNNARYFNILIGKIDGSGGSKKRDIIEWWISVSSYGTPLYYDGYHSAAIISGYAVSPRDPAVNALNRDMSSNNGYLTVKISNSNSYSSGNFYLMANIQGITYQYPFSLATASGVGNPPASGGESSLLCAHWSWT